MRGKGEKKKEKERSGGKMRVRKLRHESRCVERREQERRRGAETRGVGGEKNKRRKVAMLKEEALCHVNMWQKGGQKTLGFEERK